MPGVVLLMNNILRVKRLFIVVCLIMLASNTGLALSFLTTSLTTSVLQQNTKPNSSANSKPNQSTPKDTENIEVAPEVKSAEWYYERALIYYLREQQGRATIELYKALEKDPDNVNVNYLLGILFRERKLWKESSDAFFKVTQTTKIEHLPARLELAFVSVQLNNYQVTFLQLEKILQLMKLDKSFRSRLYQYQVDASTEKDSSNLKKKLKIDVKSSLENFITELTTILSDTAESYSEATVKMGLNDSLIYNELVQLYDEEEEENDNKALEVLNEFLKKQKGFSPVLLSQIGAIYQKQSKTAEAIACYERVVKQLTFLGFSEAAGDFSTEELQTLQTQPKLPTSTKPTPKRIVKDNKAKTNLK